MANRYKNLMPTIRRFAAQAGATLDHPLPIAAAQFALLVAIACLPLSAAATFDLAFTLTISYLALAAAVALSLPAIWRGWSSSSRLVRGAAVALVGIYLAGVLFGSDRFLDAGGARSTFRDGVYLLDLLLGLGVVFMLRDRLGEPTLLRRALIALAAGLAFAASYTVYQWFAQHFDWAFADINNALNSDGVTRGHRDQGPGLIGWERPRATFKEPLFLASYLAIAIPPVIALAVLSRGWKRRLLGLCILTSLAAFVLTVSTLAWAAAGVSALAAATAYSIGRGWPRVSAAAAGLLTLCAFMGPVLFADPSAFSTLTGRSAAALKQTSQNRIVAWEAATEVWERSPVVGVGPGQSAVRLATRPELPDGTLAPPALGSAQGLWAASLIDVGLIGLIAWAAFFGGLLAEGFRRAVVSPPDLLIVGAVASATAALILSNLSADRLDVRAWVAFGLLAAAVHASSVRPERRNEAG